MTYRNAYPITRFPVAAAQRLYVEQLIAPYNFVTQAFFRHVFAANLCRLKFEDGQDWVPMYCKFIRRHFRGADWERLVDEKVLEMQNYQKAEHLCRRFRVPTEFVEHFRAGWSSSDKVVCLITGRCLKGPIVPRSTDENRNSYPPLLAEVMRFWREVQCPFNSAAMQHLVELREQGIPSPAAGGEIDERPRGRLLVDSFTLATVEQQAKLARTPGEFIHPYQLTSTGRLSESGGPLVCTKTMTRAIFLGQEILNYDISASQDRALELIFAALNRHVEGLQLDVARVAKFAVSKAEREVIAREIGIDVDTLKSVLHALKMGAAYYWSTNHDHDNDLYRILARFVQRQAATVGRSRASKQQLEETIQPLHAKVGLATTDLRTSLNEFHGVLRKRLWEVEFSEQVMKVEIRQGKLRIGNACGLVYEQGVGRGVSIDHRCLTAFLLQGLEAAFIHQLTLLGSKRGYQPLANAHDGLITVGEIPTDAVKEAQEASGFTNAELVLKPLGLSEGDELVWRQVEVGSREGNNRSSKPVPSLPLVATEREGGTAKP